MNVKEMAAFFIPSILTIAVLMYLHDTGTACWIVFLVSSFFYSCYAEDDI